MRNQQHQLDPWLRLAYVCVCVCAGAAMDVTQSGVGVCLHKYQIHLRNKRSASIYDGTARASVGVFEKLCNPNVGMRIYIKYLFYFNPAKVFWANLNQI